MRAATSNTGCWLGARLAGYTYPCSQMTLMQTLALSAFLEQEQRPQIRWPWEPLFTAKDARIAQEKAEAAAMSAEERAYYEQMLTKYSAIPDN